MDNRIGIGIIVGLVIGSSLYIWNTNKYSKLQKTLLLICIVFAPLQWVLMGLMLVYNNYTNKSKSDKKIIDNTNNNDTYIILGVIIIGLIVFSFFNHSDNTNIFAPAETNYENSSLTPHPEQNPTSPQIIKYTYAVIEVENPELQITKGYYKAQPTMFESDYVEDSYYATYRKTTYMSDIIEIKDYTEDNKNRVLDNFEKEIKLKLSDADYNYEMKLLIDCKDESKREELKQDKSKINFGQIFTFDTYSDASISKRNYEQYIQTHKNN